MKRRNFFAGAAGLAGTVGALTLNPVPALAAKGGGGGGGGGELAAPVTGQITRTATGEIQAFAGTLTISQFITNNGQVVAIGKVVGNVLNLTGQIVGSLTQAVQMIVTPQATCTVLTLTLGPLHLELLGLVIDLSRVVLTITADPTGGLLGQILCALAGTSLLDQVVALLNQLLGLFGSV